MLANPSTAPYPPTLALSISRVLPTMPWPVGENALQWRPMGTQASPDESVEVVPLGGSLQPLKDHFNSNKGKRRFLALLSPT